MFGLTTAVMLVTMMNIVLVTGFGLNPITWVVQTDEHWQSLGRQHIIWAGYGVIPTQATQAPEMSHYPWMSYE